MGDRRQGATPPPPPMTADQPPPPPPPPPPCRRYGIGYALAPKKQSSFIQPSLVSLARSRGIDLVPIDPSLPLATQGPFDAIIHKLSGEDWESQLRAFSAAHPSVPVVDPPDAIARLHNRASMLQAVSDLEPVASHGGLTFGVPRQAIVLDPAGLADPPAALRYPVIAKPLVADGSACSHKMVLIFRPDGLTRLTPPLVLQEFVNHGGVIFKVYVVDGFVRCVKRKSLPDVSDDERLRRPPEEGSLSFSQVSNMTAAADRSEEGYYETMHLEDAEMPPLSFVTEIAHGLRRAMGLRLFNFDIIRDVRAGNHYLVIDINYFPGYAKMPSYEAVLTDFFWDIVHQKQLTDGGTEHGSVFVSGDGDENREPSSSYHRGGVEEKEMENVG